MYTHTHTHTHIHTHARTHARTPPPPPHTHTERKRGNWVTKCCSHYNTDSALMAEGLTAVVTLSVVIFCCQTNVREP